MWSGCSPLEDPHTHDDEFQEREACKAMMVIRESLSPCKLLRACEMWKLSHSRLFTQPNMRLKSDPFWLLAL